MVSIDKKSKSVALHSIDTDYIYRQIPDEGKYTKIALEGALHANDFDPSGFRWIDCSDNENSVVSLVRFARRPPATAWMMVFNFTPVPREAEYRIGVPDAGVVCRAAQQRRRNFGGSDVGNGGGVPERAGPCPRIRTLAAPLVPPLGCLLLKPR